MTYTSRFKKYIAADPITSDEPVDAGRSIKIASNIGWMCDSSSQMLATLPSGQSIGPEALLSPEFAVWTCKAFGRRSHTGSLRRVRWRATGTAGGVGSGAASDVYVEVRIGGAVARTTVTAGAAFDESGVLRPIDDTSPLVVQESPGSSAVAAATVPHYRVTIKTAWGLGGADGDIETFRAWEIEQ